VSVESGAGAAGPTAETTPYRAAGARDRRRATALWANPTIVFKVRPPSAEEIGMMRKARRLAPSSWPAQNPELMHAASAKRRRAGRWQRAANLPRARARLPSPRWPTSPATRGYRGGTLIGRFFTGQSPRRQGASPKVYVHRAGVAGLAESGTASSLGASCAPRHPPEVADQVVSMGGESSPWTTRKRARRGRLRQGR